MSPPQNPSDTAAAVERAASQQLRGEFPYTHCFSRVICQFAEGKLVLRGTVPSFYLKQVLLQRLRGLPGVEYIDNQVDVVSASGLSSVRTEPAR